jgi:hypothetical protein
MKPTFSIFKAISESFTLSQKNTAFVFSYVVISIVLALSLLAVPMVLPNQAGLGSFLSVVVIFLLQYVAYGFMRASVQMVDGQTPTTESFMQPFNEFARFVLGGMFFMTLLSLGILFFVFPGIFVFMKYLFVPVVLATENIGIRAAFSKSDTLTRGHGGKMFGLFIISVVYAAVIWFMTVVSTQSLVFSGLRAVVVTLISVIVTLSMAHMLRQLQNTQKSGGSAVPETPKEVAKEAHTDSQI